MKKYLLCQSASATLVFVLFIVPILFLLSILSLGVADYLNVTQNQQKQLDQAVLLGAAHLQNPTYAFTATHEFLSKSTQHSSDVTIDVDPDQNIVAVKLNTKSKFSLASYFGIDSKTDLRLRSAARLRKQNVIIVFDNSAYLSQDPYAKNPIFESDFVAAQFIKDNFNNFSFNQFASSPEQLTQICFNPTLQRLKLSTIEFLNYFKNLSSDISLLASPSVITTEIPGSTLDQIFYSKNSVDSSVSFQASSYCAGAAEHENYQYDYRFPKRSNHSEPIIHYIDGSYNLSYNEHLSPEEVVWSRSSNYHQLNLNLESVLNQIFQGNFLRLNNDRNNKLIFLLGDLPRSDGLIFPDTAIVERMRKKLIEILEHTKATKRQLSIYFLIIPNSDNFTRVKANHNEWESFLSSVDDMGTTLKLRSFLYSNDQALVNNIQEIVKDEQITSLLY